MSSLRLKSLENETNAKRNALVLQSRPSHANLAFAATEGPAKTRESVIGKDKKRESVEKAGNGDPNIADQSITALTNITDAELETLDENQKALDKRVMQVMKSSYWTQYEKGLISSDAVYVLTQAADQAMDEHDLDIHIQLLKQYFEIPGYIEKMHTYQGIIFFIFFGFFVFLFYSFVFSFYCVAMYVYFF